MPVHATSAPYGSRQQRQRLEIRTQPSIRSDFVKTFRPIVSASREYLHLCIRKVNLDAIAVEFYFVIHRVPFGDLAIDVAKAGSMKPGRRALMPAADFGIRLIAAFAPCVLGRSRRGVRAQARLQCRSVFE